MAPQIDVDSILDASLEDIEAPKIMPRGYYRATVVDLKSGKSREKKTPFVQYQVTPTEALDDVDQDALAEVENWTSRKIRTDSFWLTPDAAFRLKDFFIAVGLTSGTMRENIPLAKDREVMIYLDEVPSTKDPDRSFNAITEYLPVN